MPNFNANVSVSSNNIKSALKGNLNFVTNKPSIFPKNATVTNFRNFAFNKAINASTNSSTPTATTRTVGQLFP